MRVWPAKLLCCLIYKPSVAGGRSTGRSEVHFVSYGVGLLVIWRCWGGFVWRLLRLRCCLECAELLSQRRAQPLAKRLFGNNSDWLTGGQIGFELFIYADQCCYLGGRQLLIWA